MSLWTEVLDQVAKKHGIMYWGREIENGRPYGIVRFNTSNMRPKHFIAIAQAIAEGKHLLQEISIQFSCQYPPTKLDEFDNQFLPGGIHYKYLSWLDQLIPPMCNPYPNKENQKSPMYNVFDKNMSGIKPPSAADLKPKDVEVTNTQLQENRTQRYFMQTLKKIVTTICDNISGMINLKLLAFYNMDFEALMGTSNLSDLLEGIMKLSYDRFLFEGLIFKNCKLGRNASKIFQAVKNSLSIRLLALVNTNIDPSCASDLSDAVLAHRNQRDDKIWEKALKNEKINFSRSKSLAKSTSTPKKSKTPTTKQRSKSPWPMKVIERDVKSAQAKPTEKKMSTKDYLRKKDKEMRTSTAVKRLEFTQEELLKFRIRAELKGLSFLDLSYNNLDNDFLEKLCDVLRDDTYIHSLELTGNNFDLQIKTLRLGELLFEPNYGEEVEWNKMEKMQIAQNGYKQSARAQQQNELTKRLMSSTKPMTSRKDGKTVPHSMEQIIQKPIQTTRNKKLYLPIEVAIQKDIIEKLDHFTTLDNFQKFILEHIRPNYMSENNNKLTTIQLLQNYCSSAAELDELIHLRAHPLVELLLANCFIIYLSLDERTNYALQKFVQLRLKLNKQCMQEVLMNYCGRKLTEIEHEEIELAMKQNLQNIESMANKLTSGRQISSIRLQNRTTSTCKQMTEQYGKDTVNDLLKQHEKISHTKEQRSRKLNSEKTTEEVLNEIRDGINQKKYIIKGVNETLEEEKRPRRNPTPKKVTQKQGQSSQVKAKKPEPKGRIHQVKTTTSIREDAIRQGKTKHQTQQKVARALSRPKQRPKPDYVDHTSMQTKEDERRVEELVRQIEQQKREIQQLQSKIRKETQKQVAAEQEPNVAQSLASTKKRSQKPVSESDNESLFNEVLDKAHRILMDRAGGDRQLAIQLFNRYQTLILDTCEEAMNLVKSGELQRSQIQQDLDKKMVFE